MDALAGPASQRVREFIEHELAPFAVDLETAAPGHKPSPELVSLARRFSAAYGQPLKLASARNRRNGKVVWGPDYDGLLERIAGELTFLYDYERPTLKRCVLCDGVFVSREKRANCSWTLWDHVTEAELQRCSPPDAFDNWTRSETALAHRRERKRLTERIRQEKLRAGGNENAARVVSARQARAEYTDAHGKRRRGPKQPVAPPMIDVVTTPDPKSPL